MSASVLRHVREAYRNARKRHGRYVSFWAAYYVWKWRSEL